MNQERIRLWVEALRSGSYRQARHKLKVALRDSDGNLTEDVGYCCLGVMCEVAIANGLNLATEEEPGDAEPYYRYGVPGRPESWSGGYPPSVVLDWYGIGGTADGGPIYVGSHPDGKRIYAVEANDDIRWDFNRIADGVERIYLTDPTAEEVAS